MITEIDILKNTILNLDNKIQRLQAERKEIVEACTLAENTWKAWKEACDDKDALIAKLRRVFERQLYECQFDDLSKGEGSTYLDHLNCIRQKMMDEAKRALTDCGVAALKHDKGPL